MKFLKLDGNNDNSIGNAKQLTPSGANNSGGFSVPCYCINFIFPTHHIVEYPLPVDLLVTMRGSIRPALVFMVAGTVYMELVVSAYLKFVIDSTSVADIYMPITNVSCDNSTSMPIMCLMGGLHVESSDGDTSAAFLLFWSMLEDVQATPTSSEEALQKYLVDVQLNTPRPAHCSTLYLNHNIGASAIVLGTALNNPNPKSMPYGAVILWELSVTCFDWQSWTPVVLMEMLFDSAKIQPILCLNFTTSDMSSATWCSSGSLKQPWPPPNQKGSSFVAATGIESQGFIQRKIFKLVAVPGAALLLFAWFPVGSTRVMLQLGVNADTGSSVCVCMEMCRRDETKAGSKHWIEMLDISMLVRMPRTVLRTAYSLSSLLQQIAFGIQYWDTAKTKLLVEFRITDPKFEEMFGQVPLSESSGQEKIQFLYSESFGGVQHVNASGTKFVAKLINHTMFTTGFGSTSAGSTVKDGREWMLEAKLQYRHHQAGITTIVGMNASPAINLSGAFGTEVARLPAQDVLVQFVILVTSFAFCTDKHRLFFFLLDARNERCAWMKQLLSACLVKKLGKVSIVHFVEYRLGGKPNLMEGGMSQSGPLVGRSWARPNGRRRDAIKARVKTQKREENRTQNSIFVFLKTTPSSSLSLWLFLLISFLWSHSPAITLLYP